MEEAAAIPCEQVLGTYRVAFIRACGKRKRPVKHGMQRGR